MPRPFTVIGFTVFFVSAFLYDSEIRVTATVLMLLAVALVVSLCVKNLREQRVFPCAFASGILACILLVNSTYFSYLPAVSYDGKICSTVAQITSEPTYNYGNYYYYADVISLDGASSDLKVRLSLSSPIEADAYDAVEGDFAFYKLGSSSEEALAANKANGIYLGAYPVNGEYSIMDIPESEKSFLEKIINLRVAIKNKIRRMLPDENGALVTALIIGEKSGLSAKTLNVFQEIGITHVICVSGMHLSLWAMLIMKILKGLNVNYRVSSVIAALGVAAFMLVAGLSYSVIRSGVMMLLYLLSKFLMKSRDSLNSLGFSLVVLALYNPFSMGSVGLQLSALATLGIILYSEHILPEINEVFSGEKFRIIKTASKKIITAIAVPVSASAFTMPVLLSLYGGFNFISVFANMIAVPISTACMLLGAGGTVISTVLPNNLNVVGNISGRLADFLIEFSDVVADFNLLTFKTDIDNQYVIICGVLVVCCVAVISAYAGNNLKVTATALSLVIFTGSIMFSSVSRTTETRLNVMDVGNGTSILLSVGGNNILIGCGGTDKFGESNIIDTVESIGSSVDTIIVPDEDEYSTSYLLDTLMYFRPERIYCGALPAGCSLLLDDSEILDINNLNYSDGINIRSVTADGSVCLLLRNEDISALICFDPVFDYSKLPDDFKNTDVIIMRNDYPVNIENNNCKLIVFNAENQRAVLLQDELEKSDIKYTATGNCGNIVIRSENGFLSVNRE